MSRAQEVRHEVLLQLYGAGYIGATAEHMARVAKRSGFNYSEEEIRGGLLFLVSQGLVSEKRDAVTGQQRYTISGTGMLAWEESNQ